MLVDHIIVNLRFFESLLIKLLNQLIPKMLFLRK